jgi:uncharacterized membrane protein
VKRVRATTRVSACVRVQNVAHIEGIEGMMICCSCVARMIFSERREKRAERGEKMSAKTRDIAASQLGLEDALNAGISTRLKGETRSRAWVASTGFTERKKLKAGKGVRRRQRQAIVIGDKTLK